jgi:type III restriction enzyme
MLTKEVVEEADLLIPFPSRPEGVIAYFVDTVLRYAGLSRAGRFAELAPLLDQYLRERFFTETVDIAEPAVIKRLSEPDARQLIVSAFVNAINRIGIQPLNVKIERAAAKVSHTPAFPWSGRTYPGRKTIFNLVACDLGLEVDMAEFLDKAKDVVAYAKNAPQTRFFIEYVSSVGGIRYYYPDFIVQTTDGTMFLVETKGIEDAEVPIKDDRARKWCRDAGDLTGTPWYYVKVPYAVFQNSSAETFDTLYRHAMSVL